MSVAGLQRHADHQRVSRSLVQIRHGAADDAQSVCDLAEQLAQSFPFSEARFHDSYAALLSTDDACLLVAADGDEVLGYLLGFSHITFYANGPVAWVEEILVQPRSRAHGIGRALMEAFEGWAMHRNCAVAALATRRAAPFYAALGYEESASYLRKILPLPPDGHGAVRR
jgi:GNAT superfamily N-acetyltransferase